VRRICAGAGAGNSRPSTDLTADRSDSRRICALRGRRICTGAGAGNSRPSTGDLRRDGSCDGGRICVNPRSAQGRQVDGGSVRESAICAGTADLHRDGSCDGGRQPRWRPIRCGRICEFATTAASTDERRPRRRTGAQGPTAHGRWGRDGGREGLRRRPGKAAEAGRDGGREGVGGPRRRSAKQIWPH
jgi:hypothetical protein